MYKYFKISIQNSDLVNEWGEKLEQWKHQGEKNKKDLEDHIEKILQEVTNEDDVIDGEKLSKTWFPVSHKDVFLSYSHNDEDLALIIVGILNDVFGLNVFMDSLVWGSADGLLKVIDDKYCKQRSGTYNYTKRNFSTSHIHAMLSTSIMSAMDHTEVVFFLNTENSRYKLKEAFLEEHTLSPWIYEEIMYATMLRKIEWQKYRNKSSEKVYFEKSLNVAYPIQTDDFPNITCEILREWQKKWDERTKTVTGPYGDLFSRDDKKITHPLNVLYEMILDVS